MMITIASFERESSSGRMAGRAALQLVLNPGTKPPRPMTIATMPRTSIQIARSLGAPVKNREMSELAEFIALTPKIVRRMPRENF